MNFPKCELYVGDTLDYCLQQIQAIDCDPPQASKVDLVFGSPPYENCRDYGDKNAADYSGEHFNLRGEAWVAWAVERFRAQLAICRGAVVWVVEGKTEDFSYSGTPLLLFADLKRAGVTMRKPLAYRRVGIAGSGGPDGFRNDYEFCIVGTNGGKLPWSDNTACGAPPKFKPGGAMSHRTKAGPRLNARRNKDGTTTQQNYKPPEIANPGNVIDVPHYTARDVAAKLHEYGAQHRVMLEDGDVIDGIVGGGLMGEGHDHEANEAPFPAWLAERFVRSWCPPEGIVYDPFTGGGTTAAVCLRYGRNFVGTDVRADQIEKSWRRIDDVKRAMTLEALQKGIV